MIGRYSNIKLLEQNDFNITPPGVYIWPGEFPYKTGDEFPDAQTKLRASEYLTNEQLYKNNFNNILDNVFSWSDYWQNPVTNSPNMAIIADLPDFNITTESWVELIAAKPPRIISSNSVSDSEVEQRVGAVSDIIRNSNFASEYQDIIRSAYCMLGNKVVRVNKTEGGSVSLVNMPVKCWIPFVNNSDLGSIEVNLFFNIFKTKGGDEICQFICYYEDGLIEKRSFNYRSGVLGEMIGEVESTYAFNSKLSPIVVFSGDRISGSIFGNSQYKYWDASISFAIRSYEALGVLIEQLKEIYRVLPDGTTRTDEDTGITFQSNTGAVVYKGDTAPGVNIVKAQIELDQAINVYTSALKRVAKDTGLPISYFDETNLGGKISADALRTSMFRSELKAEKIISLFDNDIKRLIVRMAKAVDIDINVTDFDIETKTGFIVDDKYKMELIQARTGGAVTMSISDAIAAYDNVSISQAKRKADELAGIKSADPTVTIENTSSGGESTVDNGVSFDHVSNDPKIVKPIIESPIGLI